MKILDMDEFNNKIKEIEISPEYNSHKKKEVSRAEQIERTMKELDNPINSQKHIIAQLKIYVEDRIEDEIVNDGELSNMTRIWSKDLIQMLNNLNASMYGRKSVNLNLGNEGNEISHTQIASKIRQLKSNK